MHWFWYWFWQLDNLSCSCVPHSQHSQLLVFFKQAHGYKEASFTAAPKVGPESQVTFLAIADMGQAEVDGSNEQSEMLPALNTTRLMIAEADDKQLLIHNGDISYAR